MKLEERRSTVEGNVTAKESIAMSVDMAAMPHIMDVLTNLYEDARKAIIREYTTNARDAHIEAGVDRAIEVTLPTQLSPFLRIRDFGTGLSRDDVREIYSQYGSSTKRNTNDQTGALGLGCKSALAYTEQFTLTARKDGQEISVIIGRTDEGAGTMEVVSETATSEPDGVEVAIPTRREDFATIREHAEELFSFWAPGTVLLNEAEPERVDGMWLSDELCITSHDSYGYHPDLVVMGNVPYPIDPGQHPFETGLGRQHRLIAFVPIGSVAFTPPREALRYTPGTKETLNKVIADYEKAAKGHIAKQIAAATTKHEALTAMVKWQRVLPSKYAADTYTFNGVVLPSVFNLPKRQALKADGTPVVDSAGQPVIMEQPRFPTSKVKDYVLSRVSKERYVGAEVWHATVWITGFDKHKLTADQKRKMDGWVVEKFGENHGKSLYVLLEDEPSNKDWLDPKSIVEWDVINARKLPKRTTNSYGYPARIPGSYDLYENGSHRTGVDANDVMATKLPLYHVEGNAYEGRPYTRVLDALGEKYVLVLLPANRVAKYERTFKQSKPVGEAIQAKFDAWKSTLTNDEREALKMHDAAMKEEFKIIARMNPDDPDLVKCGRVASVNIDSVLTKRQAFAGVLQPQRSGPFENPLSKYPLWPGAYGLRRGTGVFEHTKLYLNAAYAARTKED